MVNMAPQLHGTLLYPSLCWNDAETGHLNSGKMTIPESNALFWGLKHFTNSRNFFYAFLTLTFCKTTNPLRKQKPGSVVLSPIKI